jgi:hypothetical protein
MLDHNLKRKIMKKLLILAGLILTGWTASAMTTNITTIDNANTRFINGYGNSFIFVEGGIEFSVFPDGQFDFNILRNRSHLSVSIGSPNLNLSFNSGYNYNTYVQYDEFGAVIQIENTPVYYDYYGRVSQIGNIRINYNNGFVSRVGGLFIHYNRYNVYTHATGFINNFNRFYVYRPWHQFYRIPAYNYCVVYNRPYRRYYTPVRYNYSRPYYNNHRPVTAVASRRGVTIERNRDYATARDRYKSSSRKNDANRTNTSNRRDYASVDKNERVHNSVRRSSNINESNNKNRTVNNSPVKSNRISRADVNNNNNITRTRTTENVKRRSNTVSQKPNSSSERKYNKTSTRSTPNVTRSSSQTRTKAAAKNNKSSSRNNIASSRIRRQ